MPIGYSTDEGFLLAAGAFEVFKNRDRDIWSKLTLFSFLIKLAKVFL